MEKIKVYLDTSVISALFDNRNPERQDLTQNFIKEVAYYECFISEIVLAEINDIKHESLKMTLRNAVINYDVLEINEENRNLANKYIENNAIPTKYSEDALHLAIATQNKIDYFLSWNFRHIVKIKTRKIINNVNLSLGYPKLKILTPAELL